MITWIKMTSELEEKPEVLEMSAILGLPKLHIVGCLWRVWTWFDLHSKDGNARVTLASLNSVTGVHEFAETMQKVGWLCVHENGVVSVPNFDRHNGENAKRRAQTAKRQALFRAKNSNAPVTLPSRSRNAGVTQRALPDKIRLTEDKSSVVRQTARAEQVEISEGEWQAEMAAKFPGIDIPAELAKLHARNPNATRRAAEAWLSKASPKISAPKRPPTAVGGGWGNTGFSSPAVDEDEQEAGE